MCKLCAWHVVSAGALVIWFNPATAVDTTERYLDVTAGFSRGDFDTGQNTDLSRLQLAYGQVTGRYDFSVTLPYLFLSDNIGDESGLGDINLHAGIDLSENSFAANSFYGSVSVKLPTADELKALGTGETDVGGFLSYTHRFDVLNFSLMGGYIVTGDNPIQSYNDISVYSAGLSKYYSPWYVYGSLDGRQQILETGDNPLELSGGFFYQLETSRFLKAEGFKGLNNASPDFGITVGLVSWF